jgi:hypothetical protein
MNPIFSEVGDGWPGFPSRAYGGLDQTEPLDPRESHEAVFSFDAVDANWEGFAPGGAFDLARPEGPDGELATHGSILFGPHAAASFGQSRMPSGAHAKAVDRLVVVADDADRGAGAEPVDNGLRATFRSSSTRRCVFCSRSGVVLQVAQQLTDELVDQHGAAAGGPARETCSKAVSVAPTCFPGSSPWRSAPRQAGYSMMAAPAGVCRETAGPPGSPRARIC